MEKTLKVLKGFGISILIFLLCSVIFGVLLKFTGLPEKWGIYYILISLCFASVFFGFYMGYLLKKRGLLYGFAYSAMLVIAIVYVTGVLCMQPFILGFNDLRYLVCIVFGGIGGMLGVNAKN
ncbi:MAG: TIGR04086 family membrane protein [Anaerovorax sp.]